MLLAGLRKAAVSSSCITPSELSVASLDEKCATVLGSGGVQPPAGNTGGKITINSIKIDWANLVIQAADWEMVAASLVGRLGSFESRDKGMHGYHNSVRWECGAFLSWTADRVDALLSLNGTACGLLGPVELLELMQFVASRGGHATRVDVAFDDHDRLASMEDVHAAALAGNVAGFKRYDARRPRDLISGELEGDSAYFGRRGRDGSGTFVRVYDKKLESKGELDCIRWEPEFSGDRVQLLFADIVACQGVEDLTRVLAGAVGGCISFVQRRDDAHGHLARMELLPWWKKIQESLGCVRYRVVRKKPKLQQTAEWIQAQVSRPLAKIRAAVDALCGMGTAFIHSMIDRAEGQVDVAEVKGRAVAEMSMGYVLQVIQGRGGGGRRRQAQLMPAAAAAVCCF